MWTNAGKPRQGPVYDLHVKCKSRFKYALRFIKNNENMLLKEALAKNLADLKAYMQYPAIHTNYSF